jgi:B3/4 domain
MHFEHSAAIWSDYPELVAGAVFANGISSNVSTDSRIALFTAIAESRLAASTEGEFPEIQAWRRAFSRMGLRPTQYRCASEALLRRYRTQRELPRIHPLVDLCNAVSLAFAIPVAVFDVDRIAENMAVRYARGDEDYLSFPATASIRSRMRWSSSTPRRGCTPGDGRTGRVRTRRYATRRPRASSSSKACTARRVRMCRRPPPRSRTSSPPSGPVR